MSQALRWAHLAMVLLTRVRSLAAMPLEQALGASTHTSTHEEIADRLTLAGQATLGTALKRGIGVRRSEQSSSALPDPLGFVQAQVALGEHFNAGALILHRIRTRLAWDRGRGKPVTHSDRAKALLEAGFIAWRQSPWHLVAGDYATRFATGLVFANAGQGLPGLHPGSGRHPDTLGHLAASASNRGFAVSLEKRGVGDAGTVDVTVFGSHRTPSVQRSDIWVGHDRWHGDGRCHTDSDCATGTICGIDQLCRSVTGGTDGWGTKPSVERGFREILAGANVTYHHDDNLEFAFTGYQSLTDISIARDTHASFAWGSAYPQRRHFGAVGIGGHLAWKRGDMAGEAALSDRLAHAIFGRVRWTPAPSTVLAMSLRSYGPAYDNPHTAAPAAPDETLGNQARNERGITLDATYQPTNIFRLASHADVWQHPRIAFTMVGVNTPVYAKPSRPLWDFHTRHRLELRLGGVVAVSMVLRYAANDVSHSGAQTAKKNRGGTTILGAQSSNDDALRTLAWHIESTAWRRAQISAGARASWSNPTSWRASVQANRLWLRVRLTPWRGTMLSARIARGLHKARMSYQCRVNAADAARCPVGALSSYAYDRGSPSLTAQVRLAQTVVPNVRVDVRYDHTRYRDERPAYFSAKRPAFDAYHALTARLALAF